VWHEACWKAHGKPEFTGPSGGGRDQGYFVGEYDPEEPLTLIEVEALRLQDIRRAKAEHEASKKGMAEYKAQVAAGVTPEMFTKARELKQAFEKVKKLADAAQEIQELAWRHAKDSDGWATSPRSPRRRRRRATRSRRSPRARRSGWKYTLRHPSGGSASRRRCRTRTS
jgi:uncharacterized membrane protein YccC